VGLEWAHEPSPQAMIDANSRSRLDADGRPALTLTWALASSLQARVFACRRSAGGPYTGSKIGREPRLAALAIDPHDW